MSSYRHLDCNLAFGIHSSLPLSVFVTSFSDSEKLGFNNLEYIYLFVWP